MPQVGPGLSQNQPVRSRVEGLPWRPQSFHLAPLLLGGTPEAFGKAHGGAFGFFSSARVLGFGRLVFEKLADQLRADALFEEGQHLHGAVDVTHQGGDGLAHMDLSGRFDVLAGDFNVAGRASAGGQRAAFVEAHRPQVFINAHAFQTHQLKVALRPSPAKSLGCRGASNSFGL